MSIKETLKRKREEYWNSKLQYSVERITEYVSEYQDKMGFLNDCFTFKLYVGRSKPKGINSTIYIGMEEQIPDEKNTLVFFRDDEQVRFYLNKLKAILKDEGVNVIYTIEDFSEDKMKTNEMLHILTGEIVI